MYVVLILAIVAGLATTLLGSGVVGEAYNYRETVSVWFRSIFILQPDGDPMAVAPLSFQIHAMIGMVLFALWPFTRLVHAFSAPIGYLFRPYIVYRTRDVARGEHCGLAAAAPRLVTAFRGGDAGTAGAFEDFGQVLAADAVAFGLLDLVDDDRATLAAGLAAAAFLLRSEVGELGRLQRGGVLSFLVIGRPDCQTG